VARSVPQGLAPRPPCRRRRLPRHCIYGPRRLPPPSSAPRRPRLARRAGLPAPLLARADFDGWRRLSLHGHLRHRPGHCQRSPTLRTASPPVRSDGRSPGYGLPRCAAGECSGGARPAPTAWLAALRRERSRDAATLALLSNVSLFFWFFSHIIQLTPQQESAESRNIAGAEELGSYDMYEQNEQVYIYTYSVVFFKGCIYLFVLCIFMHKGLRSKPNIYTYIYVHICIYI